jgi:hypothetical protein
MAGLTPRAAARRRALSLRASLAGFWVVSLRREKKKKHK